MAQKCKNWLSHDADGVPILDYAGAAARNTFPESGELVDKALAFAEAELDKFQREGNAKLSERYSLLRQYLTTRRNHVWR
jgi:hypothetical protein